MSLQRLHRQGHFGRRQLIFGGAGLLAASMCSERLVIGQQPPQSTDPAADQEPTDATSSAETVDAVDTESTLSYDLPRTDRWKFGLVLDTSVTCTNAFATFVVPMDWPEQKVNLVSQTVDPMVTGWEIRSLQDGAKQVALQMPRIAAGSSVELSLIIDIERSRILPPSRTDGLVIPKRLSSETKIFMGNSPNIDSSNGRIKRAARDLAAETHENDWAFVERIYDFVREQVKYVEGPIRKASDALRRGEGDCEDMTSLFVALCRNNRIPARMVWIPDHCYPEFYLENADGQGTWFPCQAAGTRQFGRMDEYRPILQKGDDFKVPERKTRVRYVSEFFKCEKVGRKNPRPTFIRAMVGV